MISSPGVIERKRFVVAVEKHAQSWSRDLEGTADNTTDAEGECPVPNGGSAGAGLSGGSRDGHRFGRIVGD
jgi:hypothetical protein